MSERIFRGYDEACIEIDANFSTTSDMHIYEFGMSERLFPKHGEAYEMSQSDQRKMPMQDNSAVALDCSINFPGRSVDDSRFETGTCYSGKSG